MVAHRPYRGRARAGCYHPSVPELPEVETVAAGLRPSLRGAHVAQVRVLRSDVVRHGTKNLSRALRGRTVLDVGRHGKLLIVQFDPEGRLSVHLGMTGRLVLARRDQPLAPHTHVVLGLRDRAEEVRFQDPRRFGGLWWSGRGGRPEAGRFSAPLGPDALRVGLREFRTLAGRHRQVKALLLDQSAIAGLGNIYCDEALFRARIHPRTRASSLSADEVGRLHRAIRTVLREAIAAGGSSLRDYVDADGNPGWFQVRHRVYGREGEPCRRCRTSIARELLASRSTHYCPRCQPPVR